jgi:hypothetical protein
MGTYLSSRLLEGLESRTFLSAVVPPIAAVAAPSAIAMPRVLVTAPAALLQRPRQPKLPRVDRQVFEALRNQGYFSDAGALRQAQYSPASGDSTGNVNTFPATPHTATVYVYISVEGQLRSALPHLKAIGIIPIKDHPWAKFGVENYDNTPNHICTWIDLQHARLLSACKWVRHVHVVPVPQGLAYFPSPPGPY